MGIKVIGPFSRDVPYVPSIYLQQYVVFLNWKALNQTMVFIIRHLTEILLNKKGNQTGNGYRGPKLNEISSKMADSGNDARIRYAD